MVDPDVLTHMRRTLRNMVLAVTAQTEDDQQKMRDMLEGVDDKRLSELAQEAVYNLKRFKGEFDVVQKQAAEVCAQILHTQDELRKAVVELDMGRKAMEERAALAARVKELQKEVDPERIAIETMYAVEKATKTKDDEIAALKRSIAEKDSEIGNLKRSKKKLREALDRLADKE